MSMESIDKLRELAADINSAEIIDQLGEIGKFVFHSEWLDSWHKAFDAACDEIESEIAERYMELPVDRDGVPIRVGDTMVYTPTDNIFDVIAIAPDCIVDDGGYTYRNFGNYRHYVKTRTIEDVLRDCCNEWNEHCGNDWEQSVYAKYADEIRGLL